MGAICTDSTFPSLLSLCSSYSSPHITSILSLHFSSILFSLLNHLLSFYSLHSSLITIFSLHYISSHHYPHCFLQCVVFWSKTSSSQIVGSIACLKLVIGFGCDVVLTAKRQMIGSFSLFDWIEELWRWNTNKYRPQNSYSTWESAETHRFCITLKFARLLCLLKCFKIIQEFQRIVDCSLIF